MFLYILLLLFLQAPTFPSEYIDSELANKADEYCDAVTELTKYNTWNFRLKEFSGDNYVNFNKSDPGTNLNIRLCGSQNGTCNGQKSYGLCLHKSDGQEVRLGNLPPKMAVFQDRLIFRYKGDACNLTHNYSVLIDMRCDISINGFSVQILSVSNHSGCEVHLVLLTSSACINKRELSCFRNNMKDYDLAVLVSKRNNQVVEINDTLTAILNLCQSHVLEQDLTKCPKDSAVCLINKTDPSNYSYMSLGQMQKNTSIYITEDENLRIDYENGDNCIAQNISTKARTSITFECGYYARKNVPEYVGGAESCNYQFVWRTTAACSLQAMPIKSAAMELRFCRVHDEISNTERDLSFFTKSTSMVKLDSGDEYHFSVCGRLSSDMCRPNSAVCKVSADGKTKTSGGISNGQLILKKGSLYLNYSGGDICESSGQRRYTIVKLLCGLIPRIDVVEKPCHTIIDMTTQQVCRENIPPRDDDSSGHGLYWWEYLLFVFLAVGIIMISFIYPRTRTIMMDRCYCLPVLRYICTIPCPNRRTHEIVEMDGM